MVTPQYEILTNSRFYLEITLADSQECIDGYFMECHGFKRSQEVISICEVTPQKWGREDAKVGRVLRTKLPGNSKSENIILKRGLCVSGTLWRWFKAVEVGNWRDQRRDGDITIYDQHADAKARFRFLKAWPVSYKISDLKAAGSEFEVEELELAVEEFIRVNPQGNEITL
ncbi:phage tail protein [Trichocoleus sp. FACHB-262]|uniref:phage tail protein n=1 Tax=Trichocoleus sp. FACHB-262 TaxID=2692869 RepID=UPI0016877C36|nr:phage tail protein [Trichocoleus sp. FACHB-262]MBD2123526.1 phage tail protein [Trichocoleus sp. FACHB-262]